MDVIIIVIPRVISIGEDMITGITSTDHTLEKFITTEVSITNGETTADTVITIIIVNLYKPLT